METLHVTGLLLRGSPDQGRECRRWEGLAETLSTHCLGRAHCTASLNPEGGRGRRAGLAASGPGSSRRTHFKVVYARVYLLEFYLQVSVSNKGHSEMTPSGANVTAAPRPRWFSLSTGVQSDWQTRVLAAITATGKHGDSGVWNEVARAGWSLVFVGEAVNTGACLVKTKLVLASRFTP